MERTEIVNQSSCNINKKRHQLVDDGTITERLRTVRWSNYSHPTGVVKPVPTDPLKILTFIALSSVIDILFDINKTGFLSAKTLNYSFVLISFGVFLSLTC